MTQQVVQRVCFSYPATVKLTRLLRQDGNHARLVSKFLNRVVPLSYQESELLIRLLLADGGKANERLIRKLGYRREIKESA